MSFTSLLLDKTVTSSMSTGYSWEGIRQVRATLLGARHVPERFCGGRVYLGRYIQCSTFTFFFQWQVFKQQQHNI